MANSEQSDFQNSGNTQGIETILPTPEVSKFLGVFLTYYLNTEPNVEHREISHGVLYLYEDNDGIRSMGTFSCGINRAVYIKNEIEKCNNYRRFSAQAQKIMEEDKGVFCGTCSLTGNTFWVTLTSAEKGDHISICLMPDSQVFTTHPEKEFIGGRGLALSRSRGINSSPTCITVILSRRQIEHSDNKIKSYLAFNYKKVTVDDEAVTNIVKRILTLNDDCWGMAVTKEDKEIIIRSALSAYINQFIIDFFSSVIYADRDIDNKCYKKLLTGTKKNV